MARSLSRASSSVHPAHRLGHRGRAGRDRAEERLRHRHEERRADALARDVAHQQPDPVALRHHVVQVAPHRARGAQLRRHVDAGALGEGPGQHRQLDVVGEVELAGRAASAAPSPRSGRGCGCAARRPRRGPPAAPCPPRRRGGAAASRSARSCRGSPRCRGAAPPPGSARPTSRCSRLARSAGRRSRPSRARRPPCRSPPARAAARRAARPALPAPGGWPRARSEPSGAAQEDGALVGVQVDEGPVEDELEQRLERDRGGERAVDVVDDAQPPGEARGRLRRRRPTPPGRASGSRAGGSCCREAPRRRRPRGRRPAEGRRPRPLDDHAALGEADDVARAAPASAARDGRSFRNVVFREPRSSRNQLPVLQEEAGRAAATGSGRPARRRPSRSARSPPSPRCTSRRNGSASRGSRRRWSDAHGSGPREPGERLLASRARPRRGAGSPPAPGRCARRGRSRTARGRPAAP